MRFNIAWNHYWIITVISNDTKSQRFRIFKEKTSNGPEAETNSINVPEKKELAITKPFPTLFL